MKRKIKFSKVQLDFLVTKRAKMLYIISCIFQKNILMPDYEIKAQERKTRC